MLRTDLRERLLLEQEKETELVVLLLPILLKKIQQAGTDINIYIQVNLCIYIYMCVYRYIYLYIHLYIYVCIYIY